MPKILQKFTTDDGDFWMEIDLTDAEFQKYQASTQESGKIPVGNDFITMDPSVNWSPEKFDVSALSLVPLFKSLQKVIKTVSPSGFEIEAGVKFKKSLNALFISGGADVDFKIKLKWDVHNDGASTPNNP